MKTAPPVLLPVVTRLGKFVAHYTEMGLAGLDFPQGTKVVPPKTATVSATVRRWHAQTTRAVSSILAGRTPERLPPLDLSQGTAFQKRVWEELLWTPCSETRSYGEIARAIGQPRSGRAVGGACGANPIPLLIPCHRVLAANRKIGGFSGGLAWKRKLLAIENIQPSGT